MLSYNKIFDIKNNEFIPTLSKRGGKIIKLYMENYKRKQKQQLLLSELVKHINNKRRLKLVQTCTPINPYSLFLKNIDDLPIYDKISVPGLATLKKVENNSEPEYSDVYLKEYDQKTGNLITDAGIKIPEKDIKQKRLFILDRNDNGFITRITPGILYKSNKQNTKFVVQKTNRNKREIKDNQDLIMIPGKVEMSFKLDNNNSKNTIWISAYIHYFRSDGCVLYHIEDSNNNYIRRSANINDLLIRHSRVLNIKNSKLYDMIGVTDIESQNMDVFSIENGLESFNKDDLIIFPQNIYVNGNNQVFINQIYDTPEGNKLIETPITTLNLNVKENDVYFNLYDLDKVSIRQS